MKKLIKIAIGILCVGIIIIATDFGLLWLPLEHSPEYPTKVAALFMAVTALVTLLLALTAVKATEQSNLREKNRRTDEIEKENRDRKERFLNEITGWLKELKDRIFSSQKGTISKAIPEELDRFRKSRLSLETWEALYNLDLIITQLNLFSSLIKEGEYIQKQASKLNTDLGNLMGVVLCHLKQRKDISVNWPKSRPTLDKIIENSEFIYNLIKDDTRSLEDIDSSEDILATIRLGRNTEAIKESIGSAVNKSIDLKMRLLQS